MSYTIFYNKCFIKVGENQYIPLAEIGDNNVYELSNRRARDWQRLYMFGTNPIVSSETILSDLKEIREYKIKTYPDYNDKSFGWFDACALYGKSIGTTTWKSFYNFFLNGIKNAVTIEKLRENYTLVSATIDGNYFLIRSTEQLLCLISGAKTTEIQITFPCSSDIEKFLKRQKTDGLK